MTGCRNDAPPSLLQLVPGAASGVDFENRIQMSDSFSILDYMYFFNGGGVAIGDINNDGLDDLYFGGNQVTSRLYLNTGNLTFRDVTLDAKVQTKGWTSGVTMVDLNADGWLDIYACQTGDPDGSKRANLLFINNGDLTFTEQATAYNLADTAYTTQAAFFDYDLDGDLDVYLLNHNHQFRGTNSPLPKKINGESANTDRLLQNTGLANGHPIFRDISDSAGILIEGFGLGVSISDINGDLWPDIYISNDFISNDILYVNQKNGTFKNQISELLAHQSHNGMGNEIADFNNDLLPDIFVADMLPDDYPRRQRMAMNTSEDLFDVSLALGYEPQYTRNTLQLNNGHGPDGLLPFSEIAQLSGVHATDWSWSALFGDLDNDGWKDLIVTNGYYRDLTDLDFISYKKRHATFSSPESQDALYLELMDELPSVKASNRLYINNRDLTFTDATKIAGFQMKSLSNGAAISDLDNDGDLDIVINNIDQQASIFQNQSSDLPGNQYIQIKLVGPISNPVGIGTKIMLFAEKGMQYQEQEICRGFQSSINSKIHFGVSNQTAIDSVNVIWPDGKKSQLLNPAINQVHQVPYHESLPFQVSGSSRKPDFSQMNEQLGLQFRHRENNFPEFKSDRSLTYLLSREGPGAAVGDLNGDGLEDFIVGGAAGLAPTLFLQNSLHSFDRKTLPSEAIYEDVSIHIFDADRDGDLDLYLVSGGTEYALGKGYYQDRLLINDGKGIFTRDTLALPSMDINGSCVISEDFDQDGDLDLFIGARSIPGAFPTAPSSILLQNNNGTFKDVTSSHAPQLHQLGMVTDAIWSDYNQDGWMDLIVVGDWMPITFLKNSNGSLQRDSSRIEGMKKTGGWWRSIAAADFDQDGDEDYVLGNQGTNSDVPVTPENPARMLYGDFDQNGSRESIRSSYHLGPNDMKISYPSLTRDELLDLLPSWKKNFTSYKKYAEIPMGQLVTDYVDLALEVTANASIYLENLGQGKFVSRNLPVELQLSTINDFLILDYNGDPYPDFLCIGNTYAPKVSTGRYDASLGNIMLGSKNGPDTVIHAATSGIIANGNTRKVLSISVKDQTVIVVVRNDDQMSAYGTKAGGH